MGAGAGVAGGQEQVVDGLGSADVRLTENGYDLVPERVLEFSLSGREPGAYAHVQIQFPSEGDLGVFLDHVREAADGARYQAEQDAEVEAGIEQVDRRHDAQFLTCLHCGRELDEADLIVLIHDPDINDEVEVFTFEAAWAHPQKVHAACLDPYRQARIDLWRDLGLFPPLAGE